MHLSLTHRKATTRDVQAIVTLLLEDELGQTRETSELGCYIEAFDKIDIDPNHYLMVVESNGEIVGTCHLTMMPSLTFMGSTRMQIEAVRVSAKLRGQGVGRWMMDAALQHAKTQGASIIQLTTNKKRTQAKEFYETLGFEASHEGMKLDLRDVH